ncbi:unnamed protein product [Cuscuta campestris]|uniref:Reverse transcriptase domain-containing protein n=1 Tax=Cuscuta campestris TaxID=132261 RepID=A0A484LSV3_9ASTE|nr:unnamed protein product [Cuscuta campestris]
MAAVVDEAAGVGAAAMLAEGLLDSRSMLLMWRQEGCPEENFPSATAVPVANPHMPYLDDEDDVGVQHSPKKGGRISSSQVSEPAAVSASNPAAHLETESAQPSDAAQVPDASTLSTTAGAQSSQASTDHPASIIQPEIPAVQPVPSRAESSSVLGRGHRQRTPNVRLTDYQTYAVTHEVSNDVSDCRAVCLFLSPHSSPIWAKLIEEGHLTPSGGHGGFLKTLKRLTELDGDVAIILEQLRLSKDIALVEDKLQEARLRAEFGHISNRFADAKIKYKTLVEQLMVDPDSLELVRLVNEQRRITNFLIEVELAFYKQKAKCDFLTKGDRCTKYFYSVVKKKRSTNSIPFMVRSDGTKTTCHSEVVDSFVDFFRGLFGTGIQVEPISSEVLPSGSLVPVSSWVALLAPITIKEVEEVVFSIGDDKAPGPDGFSAGFFKSQWQLVGPDLFEAVAEFFHHGKLLKQLNHVVIALIPKTTHNPSVKDFRHIACLNVIYKVITKTLAQRMAPLLPNLIDPAQGAFVEGRSSLIDNAKDGTFHYHPDCATLGITHLAFADDIMLFSKRDFTSVTTLMEVLNHFSAVYGLHLSPTKSNIFIAGRDRDRSEDIISLVHFPVGQLPVRYLGLPLASQRLTESDFAPLINKIDN